MGLLDRLFGRRPREEGSPRARSSREDALIAHIVREHEQGRPLEDILDDPYIRNRTTDEQRVRLLESPVLIRAVGEHTAALAREQARSS